MQDLSAHPCTLPADTPNQPAISISTYCIGRMHDHHQDLSEFEGSKGVGRHPTLIIPLEPQVAGARTRGIAKSVRLERIRQLYELVDDQPDAGAKPRGTAECEQSANNSLPNTRYNRDPGSSYSTEETTRDQTCFKLLTGGL